MHYLLLTAVTTQEEADPTVEVVIWSLLGILFISGVIWALIARVRQQGREDKYEERDN